MSWLAFFASIIASLAWPAAIVICVLLFRAKLATLLPLLYVKHKDWEASFRLEQAEREVEQIPKSPDIAPAPTPEELSRFEEIARASPRAAVLELRATIDNAIRSLARDSGFSGWQRASYGSLLRQLRAEKRIQPHVSALLDDLRAIGNIAAHDGASALSLDDARRYRDLTNRALDEIELARLLI